MNVLMVEMKMESQKMKGEGGPLWVSLREAQEGAAILLYRQPPPSSTGLSTSPSGASGALGLRPAPPSSPLPWKDTS